MTVLKNGAFVADFYSDNYRTYQTLEEEETSLGKEE